MICSRRRFLATAGVLSLSSTLMPAYADTWSPSRPLKVIVPFAPGGSNDLVARLLAPKLQAALGQPVVIENRAGAGGAIGAQAVAQAAPDGYTVLFHSSSVLIQPILLKEPGYDVQKDFVPVSLMTEGPLVLAIHPSVPAQTFSEFLAYARANGSRMFYGSAGIGASQHLVGELFNSMAGTMMQHVPYKGNGPASTALLAGEIQALFDIIPISRGLAESGRVRILAITSRTRSSSLPQTPTIQEAGVPGFDFTFWQAIWLPRRTPDAIVQRWLAASTSALADKQIQTQLAEQGFQIVGSSPSELADRMQRESVQWAKVIADAGIRAE